MHEFGFGFHIDNNKTLQKNVWSYLKCLKTLQKRLGHKTGVIYE